MEKLSKKNKYWISEYRYRELRYFCLQYKEWYAEYNNLIRYGESIVPYCYSTGDISRPVEDTVQLRAMYYQKMQAVENAARLCDPELSKYLFKAVTEGRNYDYLRGVLGIPCGRRQFYEKYRRFFWILDMELRDARYLQGV